MRRGVAVVLSALVWIVVVSAVPGRTATQARDPLKGALSDLRTALSQFETATTQLAQVKTALSDRASDGDIGGDPAAAAAGAFSNPSWLEGVDVSHWNDTIDWVKVADSGRRFAIMKATEGTGFVDPTYTQNRDGAIAAGLVVTAYHFATPSSEPGDAVAEADHYVDAAGLGVGDIIPALDLERDGGLSTSALIQWTEDWLQEVKRRTGVRPMIYSGPSRWADKMGDTEQFADEGYRLWVAHWTTGSPRVPGNDWGGRGWTFWQYTDCGHVPGIGGCVDLDHYFSTNLDLVRIPQLTVTTNAVGSVTSTPGGIDCGSRCRAVYDPGSTVSLSAVPDAGAVLVGWSGACTGSGTCSVRVLRKRKVDAVFGYALSASIGGPGVGSVTSSPPGVSCGSTGTACTGNFGAGQTVTLTETPDDGSQFDGWTGDCSGLDTTCTVTMDAAHTVTASFTDDTPPTATLVPPAGLDGTATAAFDEPVHDVSVGDLVLRVEGSPRGIASQVRCLDDRGRAASCASGDVLRAVLQPDAPLVPGQSYELVVNPAGAPVVIADRGGNPAAESSTLFTAATSIDDSEIEGWTWRAVADRRALEGSYATAHLPGASASVPFTGPNVTWRTVAGPREGKAQVFIDGRARGVFDLSGSVTRYGVAHAFHHLGGGDHVMRVVALGRPGAHGPVGTAVVVDRFQVGRTAVPADLVRYRWAVRRAAGASHGAYAVSDERGAALSLRFRGTGIRWMTVLGPDEGRAAVYLDGRLWRTIDEYASHRSFASRAVRGLADRVHVLRIVVLGQKRTASHGAAVAVDGFAIS